MGFWPNLPVPMPFRPIAAFALTLWLAACGGASNTPATNVVIADQPVSVEALADLREPSENDPGGQPAACPMLVVEGLFSVPAQPFPETAQVVGATLQSDGKPVWSGTVEAADNAKDGLGRLDAAARGCAPSILQGGQTVTAVFEIKHAGESHFVVSAPMQLRTSRARDPLDRSRSRIGNRDGRATAIDDRIQAWGSAVVEIVLNLDSLEFDYLRDRTVLHPPDPVESQQVRQRLVASIPPGALLDAAWLQAPAPHPAVLVARITRQGMDLLRQHPDMRSMILSGATDAQPARFDADAITYARLYGSAEVIISLRAGHPYCPCGGYMTARADAAQTAAMRRVFAEILPPLGDGVIATQDFASVGGMGAFLTEAALLQLYASADPRILAVDMNSPVGGVGAARSAAATRQAPTR